MLRFKEFIRESVEPLKGEKKDDSLYSDEMPDKVYYGDNGFFKVGTTVNVPEYAYKGVKTAKIVHAYRTDHTNNHLGANIYHVQYTLPKGHEDAYDRNGEPEHTKYGILSQDDLSKLNKD